MSDQEKKTGGKPGKCTGGEKRKGCGHGQCERATNNPGQRGKVSYENRQR